MNWVLAFVYLLALASWLGETVFLSFVAAPALFGSLPAAEAGAAMSLLFPGYYLLGYVCGGLLLLVAWLIWRRSRPGGGRWLAAAVVAGLSLLACLYAGLVLQPRAAALRSQLHDPQTAALARPEFDRLHRRAVQLNGGVLLGVLILAGLAAVDLGASVRTPRRLSRYSSDPLP